MKIRKIFLVIINEKNHKKTSSKIEIDEVNPAKTKKKFV